MQGIILGAGEGSRMENRTDRLPKIFIEFQEQYVYQHQICLLDRYCDVIHIMLGYGFENEDNPGSHFDVPDQVNSEVRYHIIEDWDEYENAYTLLSALENLDEEDDLAIFCGDVVYNPDSMSQIFEKAAQNLDEGLNSVATIRGIQDSMTAVNWDDDGIITEYGAIEGHQEAGLFFLHKENISQAKEILSKNKDYWFPVIFEETATKPLFVEDRDVQEFNTPTGLEIARNKYDQWI